MKATISNCSNNFGPNQHPEKLIPKTVFNVLSGKNVPIYGKGRHAGDWIYVEDHVRALEAILEKGEYGETYLVSSENEIRNIDLVKNVLKILNKGEELIKFTNDRPGHDVRYSLDPSKLKSELKWKPIYDFSERLKFTVSLYQKFFIVNKY
ncbi:MAG: GDP-mannose 4,6-dehydratase [Candidatus Micrarchaeaceae archaeon]